ncbi:uncharacterized protein [Periplaneta americana]|uniref:uncharacterized protein isoform X2 n=1 Tax=Periplaneta americana TaxID=6978 RepID=UPI0037E7DAF1
MHRCLLNCRMAFDFGKIFKMSLLSLLLLQLFLQMTSSEIYDVTTIYRQEGGPREESYFGAVHRSSTAMYKDYEIDNAHSKRGSVEVHARTNAVGLPFLLHTQNITIASPAVGVPFPECTSYNNDCEKWMKINWNSMKIPISKPPPLLGSYIEERIWTSGKNISSAKKFNSGGVSVSFNPKENDGTVKVFLLDKDQSYQRSSLYYIQIPNRSYFAPSAHILKCTFGIMEKEWYIPGIDSYRKCKTMQTALNDFTHWEKGNKYTLKISFEEGTLKVTIKYSGKTRLLFHWKDSSPIPVAYYTITTLNMVGVFDLPGESNLLALTEEDGSLITPEFTPASHRLCVSLIYYASPEDGNSLQLSARLPEGREYDFGTIETADEWKILTLRTEVPRNETLHQMKIVLRGKKTKDSHILIQRIAGCNADNPEDVLVLPDDYPVKERKSGYDVAVRQLKAQTSAAIEKKCMHGGKFDKEHGQCICPAGFVGELCEKGCGPNSYGDDCGGMCSWSQRGCRDLVMCRPLLGCSCAAGFTGFLCNVPCSSGNYGPDCGYNCGACHRTVCDLYTGTCLHGCDAGFYPPLCQQTYKHVSTAPSVAVVGYSELTVVADVGTTNLKGLGVPLFYKVQYKEVDDCDSWTDTEKHIMLPPLSSSIPVRAKLTGLKPGTNYRIRIVIIDQDGSSFQGFQVPSVTSQTMCEVPDAVPNNLRTTNITSTGFQVHWEFIGQNETWCPAGEFELQIKEDWRWRSYSVGKALSADVTDLLPGLSYQVRVRANTTEFSEPLSVTTAAGAPLKVQDLRVTSSSSSELEVAWREPPSTSNSVISYYVTYECVQLLACQEKCSDSAGEVEVRNTSVVLAGLLANAKYRVRVVGMSAARGELAEAVNVTRRKEPTVAPTPKALAMSNRTNSSVTVHWGPPVDCSGLNGFLLGYRYELQSHSEPEEQLGAGSTTDTAVSFTGLQANTEYRLKVFVLTSEGWNKQVALHIVVKTLANAPNKVERLTVYKQGRRLLGLRWAAPNDTHGTLKSFTVSYKLEGAAEQDETHRVLTPPAPCVAWPDMYCHTLPNLRPEKAYVVSVRARNTEVDADGEIATVTAFTRESAPGPPTFLRLVKRDDTSMTFEWGLPLHLNGVLRSFVINIEETDSFNDTECCQYFPVQEIVTQAEESTYTLQFSDLRPASSYVVSVSAKTVTMGPSMNVTVHTLPPTPALHQAPVIVVPVKANETFPVLVHPAMSYQGLVSGYLLLILPRSQFSDGYMDAPNSTIWDSLLEQELNQLVDGKFYVVAEFEQYELENDGRVMIGSGKEGSTSGSWGELWDPPLVSGDTYRLGLVLMLEYQDSRRLGYIESDDFVVS